MRRCAQQHPALRAWVSAHHSSFPDLVSFHAMRVSVGHHDALVAKGAALTVDADILVVGGGVNGTGVARDAAGRGLSVHLCEQDDELLSNLVYGDQAATASG